MAPDTSPNPPINYKKLNAWPFQEAMGLLKRIGNRLPKKGHVLFETGYGPSGLPHIGTFAEVARTTMVRHAFSEMCDFPTRLVAFSDDFDGLRKVPENIPNQELIGRYIGRPLTAVPDPFEQYESFAHHNNARLRAFLDAFGFDYEFKSATEEYQSGRFDQALLAILGIYDKVLEIILPTLGEERQATYSPFLPVSPTSGKVLQVPIEEHDAEAGTIVFTDEDGQRVELPVTGGHCKLQWKVDWAMRWYAQEVDYEMSGKDLIDSVNLSGQILRALGARPPHGFNYELFLDEEGHKISKSLGNGLSVEEWLRYAPQESLAHFMYKQPKTARRLYFGVIPRTIDEYLKDLAAYPEQEEKTRLKNPVWHIHGGEVPDPEPELSYDMLLNLVSVCGNRHDNELLMGFLRRYRPDLATGSDSFVAKLVEHALNYFDDFVAPTIAYRRPTDEEAAALRDLAEAFRTLGDGATAEDLQFQIYEVGKSHFGKENLRGWFQSIYEVLLGRSTGPRMGSFVAIYGVTETVALVERALAGELVAGAG